MNLLHCIGVGMVGAVKETNTNEIWLYSSSIAPLAEGELTLTADVKQQTATTASGDTKSTQVLEGNLLNATWMGEPGNRLTSPDVRPGSRVAIYQWEGSKDMWWTTYGVNALTYRLETVIYGWSANANVDKNIELDYDNFYILEISTHFKRMSFRTSMKNGEEVKYEFFIDPGNKRAGMIDSQHNAFAIESMAHRVFMVNEEKSFVEVNRKNVNIGCTDTLNMSATNGVNIQTQRVNIQANTFGLTAPGGTNITSDVTINGGLTVTKGISAREDITTGGWSMRKHQHQGVHGITGPALPS